MYYFALTFNISIDDLCQNILDLSNGKLTYEDQLQTNLHRGTYCQWLISALDENHYVNLEFHNLDVSVAI